MNVSSATTASTLLNGLSSTGLAVSGLATGLDSDKIIEGLLAIQQQRIGFIQVKQDRVTREQTAFKGIEAGLLALQGQITQLRRPQNNAFDVRTASSSNKELIEGAAASNATPGVYNFQVNSLARAHQVASQGFDSTASIITQGTLHLRVGSGATTTITIDSTNNTLAGLASAINSSAAGVTAMIVNDGSATSTQPYRLLLTSNQAGASNSITITNNLGAESGGAVKPILDSSFVGAANTAAGFSGTSVPTSNRGAASFTGNANNTYTFTVTTGGTVGTDNNIQIAYADSTGTNTGTVTVNGGDADVFKAVAQGIQVKFSAGTLVAGETFTVKGYVPLVQQATSASVTLGSGSGALTVQNASNTIDGLISGLTLNLHGTGSAAVTVASDTESAKKAITDFVSTYNDLLKFIDDQAKFDSATGTAGPLQGNRLVSAIQEQVRGIVSGSVEGLPASMNRLGALGITTSNEGRLVVNSSKLDDVLAGRVAGVSLADVRALFAFSGTSSNPGVQFVTGSTKTKASTTPYQVSLTQAARQATILAANPLAASTVLTGANNTFTISVDGATSSTITIPVGTYTRLSLAQAVQAEIDANPNLAARKVAVTLDGAQLRVTSETFGSASKVTIGTGTALTPLGFAGTETDQGLDVVGSYVVGGQVESATGTGQFLVGNTTNANTADLQVRVTLTAAQIGAGLTSNLTVTRGLASRVDVALNSLLDPISGRLKSIDEGFEESLDDLQDQIDRQNAFIETRRAALLRQFAVLESTVSQLQGISSFITAQLAALTSTNQNKR